MRNRVGHTFMKRSGFEHATTNAFRYGLTRPKSQRAIDTRALVDVLGPPPQRYTLAKSKAEDRTPGEIGVMQKLRAR
jgi:hypothetical protein